MRTVRPRLVRTPRANSAWGPWGQAALRLRCVQYTGGWYAEPVRVSLGLDRVGDVLERVLTQPAAQHAEWRTAGRELVVPLCHREGRSVRAAVCVRAARV